MARFLWVRHKPVIPVPQLQPLDARDIIKHRIEVEAVKAVVRVEAATAREKAVAAERAKAKRREKAYTAQRNTWVEAAKAKAERAPLLEVPDMIVFSDSDDSDSDDFCSFDDEFDPFEVLK